MHSTSPFEVFLPFPAARAHIARATHWRASWVVSSVQTLKERGHFSRYEILLPKEHAGEILTPAGGVWLPNSVARAHYQACDALGLPVQEQFEMGLAVGQRAHGTVLRSAAALASGASVTPWTLFGRMQRLWDRGADGGGVAVYKLGPKEGLIELVNSELLDVPYFRTAFAGVLSGIVNLFCARSYVRDVTPRGVHASCMLRFQWA